MTPYCLFLHFLTLGFVICHWGRVCGAYLGLFSTSDPPVFSYFHPDVSTVWSGLWAGPVCEARRCVINGIQLATSDMISSLLELVKTYGPKLLVA